MTPYLTAKRHKKQVDKSLDRVLVLYAVGFNLKDSLYRLTIQIL
ncbi:hypothetical protein [Escherichia phage pEC-M719-6WT.1]|uniref:Uncharacterized protein n=1 Tax=Escherichia phage pEC-M719-6WT.1 TaxID=3056220 RepID=A0AA51U889_9CAUD|nr:hypothetical protein [Escherichia phage pEC-M719-6WT.1]